MGKMANGLANDLASTILLATDRPVLMAPAMNPKMWSQSGRHPQCRSGLRPTAFISSARWRGEMAESGEAGAGRMAEPLEIVDEVRRLLSTGNEAACRQARHRDLRADP